MVSSKALYYPTIDIHDEEWIKTAYLFWDEIRTIVPVSMKGMAYNNYTTQYLEDEGFLTPFYVRPESAIVKDLVSKVKKYAETTEGKACLNQAVPYDVLYNPYSDERSEFYLHHEKLPLEIQELVGDKLGDDGWARVSDNFANYYMTLLANSIASQKSLSLITGSAPLANLTTKYSEDTSQHIYSHIRNNASSMLCQTLLVTMVMDGIKINPLTSIQDLKAFKQRHKDELNNFRNGLDEITSFNTPDDIDLDGMTQYLKDIYDRKMLLAYNDLKASLRGSRINYLTEISSLCYTGITTTFLDGLTNMSTPQQLLSGLGIYLAVKGIKEQRNKKMAKRTNKMSYLLSINNELK